MDKRYQVFISSTFSDLKDERQAVMQALMEMDCIPAGMELFPAADEEQWIFIQKVIDDCDYYVLILGGRYGSVTEDGISYTEKEFDYAVGKGIKVIALVHGKPDHLPFAKVDASEAAQTSLASFREKVCTGRLVKFWKESSELPGLVALSLQKTIKMYPAPGWVRGNQTASADVLAQINALRIENEELKRALESEKRKQSKVVDGIADGDDPYPISVTLSWISHGSTRTSEEVFNETWNSIFSKIGPLVISAKNEDSVRREFAYVLKEAHGTSRTVVIPKETMNTIAVQLSALGLVNVFAATTTQGGQAVFWQITKAGTAHLMKIRVVKKSTGAA